MALCRVLLVFVAVSPVAVWLLTFAAYLGGSNMDNPLLFSIVLFTFAATNKAALDGLTFLDRKKSDYNEWSGPFEELYELGTKTYSDIASGMHHRLHVKFSCSTGSFFWRIHLTILEGSLNLSNFVSEAGVYHAI
jgi:hypothetical protein